MKKNKTYNQIKSINSESNLFFFLILSGGNNSFLIRFLIQYGAALIENAEFGYAIKILSIVQEKNQVPSIDSEENRDNKSSIYCLIG